MEHSAEERVFSVLFFVSSSVYQHFKYNYMSCTCEIDDDTLVYACQGCGKVVDTRYGIEYRTQKPYPHSKWFCDMTCVVLRHAMLAKSIKCNMIDALDPEVQEYIEALNDIEKYIGCCAEGDTVELTSTDFVVKAKLRVSGLVC